jgi:hypothetical protein
MANKLRKLVLRFTWILFVAFNVYRAVGFLFKLFTGSRPWVLVTLGFLEVVLLLILVTVVALSKFDRHWNWEPSLQGWEVYRVDFLKTSAMFLITILISDHL